jgi:Fe-S-cluster-containing dehydrogenase component/DMSO reductase anchor subunit
LVRELWEHEQVLSAVEHFSDWHARRSQELDALARTTGYQALMPATPPSADQQYAFLVDLDACSGCKACVVACHSLNNLRPGETWRKVGILRGQLSKLPILQHVTAACHHCLEPGCLQGCPVQAYEKDPATGIVKHLDDQCFGCQYCTMMCPYEVPQYQPELGIVRKCDMCSQRLSIGEAPACVQACPHQAIRIRLIDKEPARRQSKRAETRLVATAPPSHWTYPTTQYLSRYPIADVPSETASSAAQTGFNSSAQVGGIVTPLSEEGLFSANNPPLLRSGINCMVPCDRVQPGHVPLAGMLCMTQASVGTWLVIALFPRQGDGLTPGRFGPVLSACLVATIIGVLGVHLGLLHLGRPKLAFRAWLGWKTSWLSREAIGFGVYLALAIMTCALPILAPEFRRWWDLSSLTTSLTGAVSVAASAMIYVATRRYLWSLKRLSWDFGCSTLGMGMVLVATCDVDNSLHSSAWTMLAGTILASAAALPKCLDVVRHLLAVQGKAPRDPPDIWSARSGHLIVGPLRRPWMVACALMLAAIGLASAIGLGWEAQDRSLLSAMSLVACVSLVLANGLHRYLVFASVVMDRMPGAET